jgi:hypothetical protein
VDFLIENSISSNVDENESITKSLTRYFQRNLNGLKQTPYAEVMMF